MDDTLTVAEAKQHELISALSSYGIDYTDAMDRMDNNAELYKKLALKYLDNSCLADLIAALETKDYDEGYKAAHSLKGVAGNLSFSTLFDAASAMSAALYQGEYQAAEGMLEDVKAANDKVISGLEAWQNGTL